jgi:hypothetical protein
LGVKHLDNLSDLRPDRIAPCLGLLSPIVLVSQSNFPAQVWVIRVDDGFGNAES